MRNVAAEMREKVSGNRVTRPLDDLGEQNNARCGTLMAYRTPRYRISPRNEADKTLISRPWPSPRLLQLSWRPNSTFAKTWVVPGVYADKRGMVKLVVLGGRDRGQNPPLGGSKIVFRKG